MARAIPLPAGVHSVTPNLVVRNAANAIAFYVKVFGATEVTRLEKADGRVWHAELRIGDSVLYLSDELPYSSVRAPSPEAFPSTEIRIYVEDADAVFRGAIEAGARSKRAVADVFWGDRMGIVADPFGHTWVISTHVRDVPAEEVRRIGEKMASDASLPAAGIPGT
jgi:PhnB protein